MFKENCLLWCSGCYLVQSDQVCRFCREPLVELPLNSGQKFGAWNVVCSSEYRRTKPQPRLTLGRDDLHTGFLFGSNSFISRQHLQVEATGDGVVQVSDLQSGNGTFVMSPAQADEQNGWRRLGNGEVAKLASGDPLLLSWENLCHIWLAWIPAPVAIAQTAAWQSATERILLAGDRQVSLASIASIVYRSGRHILENLHRDRGMVAVNGREVVATVLQDGDRVVVADRTYEYTPLQLIPAQPVMPIQLRLNAVAIPQRLDIDKPVHLESSQFSVIVGQSGSGKSSLMGLLSGWTRAAQATWNITMADQRLSPHQMRELVVYLPQGDILYDNLAVADSLLYSSLLLSPTTPMSEHQEQISQILRRVGLTAIQRQRIYSISGGQRRRVQIAQALLNKRATILLLDEPTSGLDLANDRNIMELLRRLARQCRAVICTTHHLASLELSDQVILLEQGKIKDQGTPDEIASENGIRLGDVAWCDLYRQEPVLSTPSPVPGITPLIGLGNRPRRWWVLLHRRIAEFCHPRAAWCQVLSQLLLIPLLIGLGIRIAWPLENGDEKRFFLCTVAVFWLAMSLAAQELQPGRYFRFVHELRHGRRKAASLAALVLFYALISLIQTAVVIAPNIGLIERPRMLVLFALLTWTLGSSGSLVGLNLGIIEARFKIPTAVTVPGLTIMQLLFSELVMGLLLGSGYFQFAWKQTQGILYTATFSRYADMAYRACYNELEAIPADFWWNLAILGGYGLLVPLLLFAIMIKAAHPQE